MLPHKICPEKSVFLMNEHQISVAIYQLSEISFQLPVFSWCITSVGSVWKIWFIWKSLSVSKI